MKVKSEEINGAKRYFDRVPRQWDAFYSHENRLMYLVNNFLRKGLYQRCQLAFQTCGDLTGKSVLDIGCGTGRYSIECAKRGAKRVLGIDFAPHMIEFSQGISKQINTDQTCEFICDNFLTHSFNEHFDITLAMGFFDYIETPAPVFDKIAQLNPGIFIASFPRFTPFWGLQRKIRYRWFKKCPIYYYSEDRLNQLFKQASFAAFKLVPYGRGFIGIGYGE